MGGVGDPAGALDERALQAATRASTTLLSPPGVC